MSANKTDESGRSEEESASVICARMREMREERERRHGAGGRGRGGVGVWGRYYFWKEILDLRTSSSSKLDIFTHISFLKRWRWCGVRAHAYQF